MTSIKNKCLKFKSAVGMKSNQTRVVGIISLYVVHPYACFLSIIMFSTQAILVNKRSKCRDVHVLYVCADYPYYYNTLVRLYTSTIHTYFTLQFKQLFIYSCNYGTNQYSCYPTKLERFVAAFPKLPPLLFNRRSSRLFLNYSFLVLLKMKNTMATKSLSLLKAKGIYKGKMTKSMN